MAQVPEGRARSRLKHLNCWLAVILLFTKLTVGQAFSLWPWSEEPSDSGQPPSAEARSPCIEMRLGKAAEPRSEARLGLPKWNSDNYYYYYEEIIPLRRSDGGFYYYDYSDDTDVARERSDTLAGEEDQSLINPLAALIAPLAGLALLGAISSMSIDPMLMELTSIKRERRSAETLNLKDTADKLHKLAPKVKQMELLETFITGLPVEDKFVDRLTAIYLKGSGLAGSNNQCLERLACFFGQNSTVLSPVEQDVTSIVLFNLMRNKLLDPEIKQRLRKSARLGRKGTKCQKFYCSGEM